jgi:serine phosphatase RsbU (regulator of sigma subunit)
MLSAPSQSTRPPGSLPTRTPAPTTLPSLEGLDLRCYYHSARTGGDFFDALVLGPHVVFLMTDIAGTRDSAHSIASATQDTFRHRAPQLFGTPGANLTNAISILAHDINQTLTTACPGVCFSPTFLGCYDLTLGVLTYINAGGQPAIFSDSDGTRILTHACMPLGLFALLTYEPAFQAFEPGARLLLLTKGVIETGTGRVPVSTERFTHLLDDHLQKHPDSSAQDLCKAILHQAHQHGRASWQSLAKLLFGKRERIEDRTAVVLARPRRAT